MIATNRAGGVADLRGPGGEGRRATGVLLLVTGGLAALAPVVLLLRYGPLILLVLVYAPPWALPAVPGLAMTLTAGWRVARGARVEALGLAGALCLLPATVLLATFGGVVRLLYVLATAGAVASVCACGYELVDRWARAPAPPPGRHRVNGPGSR